MENAEKSILIYEIIRKIWKKGKLKCETMWKLQKKPKLNSDQIWKKGKLNSEKNMENREEK